MTVVSIECKGSAKGTGSNHKTLKTQLDLPRQGLSSFLSSLLLSLPLLRSCRGVSLSTNSAGRTPAQQPGREKRPSEPSGLPTRNEPKACTGAGRAYLGDSAGHEGCRREDVSRRDTCATFAQLTPPPLSQPSPILHSGFCILTSEFSPRPSGLPLSLSFRGGACTFCTRPPMPTAECELQQGDLRYDTRRTAFLWRRSRGGGAER